MLGRGIPKIIHQSWKTSDVPEVYHAWVSTWLQNHPTWVYKLWTDDENRELIARHYPWFLRDYDNFTKASWTALPPDRHFKSAILEFMSCQ